LDRLVFGHFRDCGFCLYDSEQDVSAAIDQENRELALKLALIVPVMLVFCASMVPLYRVICEELGITQSRVVSGAKNAQVDLSRLVTVEFLANRNQNFGWQFEPLVRSIKVHPGELTTIRYRVVNTYPVPMTGRAVASYGPIEAGKYVQKLECFCFSDQTLAPREVREMPVVFRVSPDLDKETGTISISYTFFDVTGKSRS
jgi:cytochrome c oxidase assembly protein subunit 11